MRNGQQMVGALDVIALMDALKIETAVFASLDWDGRTANILSALWPERCKALVFVGGYLIGSQVAQTTLCGYVEGPGSVSRNNIGCIGDRFRCLARSRLSQKRE